MKFRYFWSFDLEMNQPSGKIIQIGICIHDAVAGTFTTKSFYVNPEEELDPFIIKLTGITQAQVDSAGNRADGFLAAKFWLEENLAGKQSVYPEPIVWGSGDLKCLRTQFPKFFTEIKATRFLDVKTVTNFMDLCHAHGEKDKTRSSLSSALARFGVEAVGTAHDAGADAENTMKLFLNRKKAVSSAMKTVYDVSIAVKEITK